MGRYFLHCDHGGEPHRDYEGAEFPDAAAAFQNALMAAEIIALDGVERGDDRSMWTLIVADDDAREVARVPLHGFQRA